MRDDHIMAEPLVQLTGVTVCAGSTTLLHDISLALRSGAPTAVIGPNGSGKTTLLRTIMGLVQPAAGTIEIVCGAEDIAVQKAIVFQKAVMLRRSVADNIAFALRTARQAAGPSDVRALLAEVGLEALTDRPARRLSGGEQQRVAIARALARRPHLLLLDEATASLDPAQTRIIEDLIGTIARTGVKIVLATHDLGQARRLAGDVVFLANGRMVEYGDASRFFSQPQTVAGSRFLAGELVI
jgi:tungstate transport system ATP-binding protein